jgi:hypothetical protein
VSAARHRVAEQLRSPLTDEPRSRRDGADAPATAQGRRDFHSLASSAGKAAQAIAEELLLTSGFEITHRAARQRGLGVTVTFVANDLDGVPWYFDLAGASFTTTGGGLLRADAVWKTLGRANVLSRNGRTPVVLLTSHLPRPRSEGELALRAVGPRVVFDAIEMLAEEQTQRLKLYAQGGHDGRPLPGFWTGDDIARL